MSSLADMRLVGIHFNIFQEVGREGLREVTPLINSNSIGLMPIQDIVVNEPDTISFLRGKWLAALESKSPQLPSPMTGKMDIAERIDTALNIRRGTNLLEEFIKHARLPLPSSYNVSFPFKMGKGERKGIIETHLPFVNARKMMLNLEEQLEIPIATFSVQHWPLVYDTEQPLYN